MSTDDAGNGLPFSEREYEHRLEALLEAMDREGIEALLLFAPESMYYLTGYDSIGYFAYHCLIVSSVAPHLRAVLREVEEGTVRATSLLSDVTYFRVGTEDDPFATTADMVKAVVGAEAKVGLELNTLALSASDYVDLSRALVRALGSASFVSAGHLIVALRLTKSARELDYIRQAAECAKVAVEAGIAVVSEGLSEHELNAVVQDSLMRSGSEYAAIPCMIGSGPVTATGRCLPTSRVMQRGDVVMMEIAGVRARYHALTMRTVSVGEPSSAVSASYELVKDAYAAALQHVGPGLPVAGVDGASLEVTERCGRTAYRFSRGGYGMGIAYPPSWLEGLNVGVNESLVLQAGMSFFIHPLILMPAESAGVFLGDTVIVTRGGREVLSPAPLELAIG